MKNIFFYHTDIGKLGISAQGDQITHLFFENDTPPGDFVLQETPLLKEAARQLHEYLQGQRRDFALPLNPHGTPFMIQVWAKLCEIPYGHTQSYKDIATAVGNPKACRAVGMANNRNPIPIFIPCHRVIGANGNLVGYGSGLQHKIYLLELERKNYSISR